MNDRYLVCIVNGWAVQLYSHVPDSCFSFSCITTEYMFVGTLKP